MPYNGAGLSPARNRKPEPIRAADHMYLQRSAATVVPALDIDAYEAQGINGSFQFGAVGTAERSTKVPHLDVAIGTKIADRRYRTIDFNAGTMTFQVSMDRSFNVDNPRVFFETNDCSILLRDIPGGERRWEMRWMGQYLESPVLDVEQDIFFIVLRWNNATFDGTNRLKFGAFADPNRHFNLPYTDWWDRVFPGMSVEPRDEWVMGGSSAFNSFVVEPDSFTIGASKGGANGSNSIISLFSILLWPMYDTIHGSRSISMAHFSANHYSEDEIRELLLGIDTHDYADFRVADCINTTSNLGMGFTILRSDYDTRHTAGVKTDLGYTAPASLASNEAAMHLDSTALASWNKVGSPIGLVSLPVANRKCGGGAYFLSTAANQGVDYSITVTAGDSWVLGFMVSAMSGAGNAQPRVEIYDQTNGAVVNYWEGKDLIEMPNESQFGLITGTAPAGCTDMRVRVMNMGDSGGIAIHGIYGPFTNLLPNTNWPANAEDPYRPDATWLNGNGATGVQAGIRDTSPPYNNSGGVSFKCGYDSWTNYFQIRKQLTVSATARFMSGHFSRDAYFLFDDGTSYDGYEGNWLYYLNFGPDFDNRILNGSDFFYISRFVRPDNTTIEYWMGKSSWDWATEDAWWDDPYLTELASTNVTVVLPSGNDVETERGGQVINPGAKMTVPITNLTASGGSIEFVYIPSLNPWPAYQHYRWTEAAVITVWGNSSNYLRMFYGNTTYNKDQFYIQSRCGGASTQTTTININAGDSGWPLEPGQKHRIKIKFGDNGRVRVYINHRIVHDKPFTDFTLVPTIAYLGGSEAAASSFHVPGEYIETNAPSGSPNYPSPVTPTEVISNSALVSAFQATTGKIPTSEFSVYGAIERGAGVAIVTGNSPGNENGASFHEFASGAVTNSFKLDEQGIHHMRKNFNADIIIAGTDPTESWALGNIYRLPNGSSTVSKVRTIPNGLHTLGISNTPSSADIWVGIGAHSGDNQTWQGRVLRSTDHGATWITNELVNSYRIYDIEHHHTGNLTLYAIGTTYGLQTFLYKRDGVDSWSTIPGVYPDWKQRIQLDAFNNYLIVMASQRRTIHLIDNLDVVTQIDLPYRAIAGWHSMATDSTGALYVATEEGFIWKCANLNSPTWEVATQMEGVANIFCENNDTTLYISTKGAGAALYKIG